MITLKEKSNATILDNWATCGTDPYKPPEAQNMCLAGIVLNHLKIAQGTNVTTSPMVEVDGQYIRTYNWTVYKLANPAQDYIEFLKKTTPELVERVLGDFPIRIEGKNPEKNYLYERALKKHERKI